MVLLVRFYFKLNRLHIISTFIVAICMPYLLRQSVCQKGSSDGQQIEKTFNILKRLELTTIGRPIYSTKPTISGKIKGAVTTGGKQTYHTVSIKQW
jgi:hypothetical protein